MSVDRAGQILCMLACGMGASAWILTWLVGPHVGWIPIAALILPWMWAGMFGRCRCDEGHVTDTTIVGVDRQRRGHPTAHIPCLSCWVCFWLCFGGGAGLIGVFTMLGGSLMWLCWP